MLRTCSICDMSFRAGDIVALTVFAEWRELKSNVAYSIQQPFDADASSLKHKECVPQPNED